MESPYTEAVDHQLEELPLLDVKGLAVDFQLPGGVFSAVKDVSFSLRQGSTVALVGESGSGKSVTAQAILGILPKNARISKGDIIFREPGILVNTTNIAKLSPNSQMMRDMRGSQISIIFQEPMVSMSNMHTIGDQVSEALFLHRRINKQQGLRLTKDMLSLVGFRNSEQAFHLYPFELSGGLRQRAMIAMALICHPAILSADEPTTALDVTVQLQILKLMRRLQRELNMGILLITHDLGVVANLADEVVVMYHGHVVERGPVEAIYNSPQHEYLKALFHSIPRFGLAKEERLTPIRDIQVSTENIENNFTHWKPEEKLIGPHLQVVRVCKSFSVRHKGKWFKRKTEQEEIQAVHKVSFDIGVGECLGLVGESGCGKSTLSKMVMRALSPTSGDIRYNDRGNMISLLGLEEEELRNFRTKIQLVFQDPFSALSPRMTILDVLTEPLAIHNIGDPTSRKACATELMKLVGLDPGFLNRYPHSFSGGQRQRISIARALALAPDLLILDEPVSALDVSVQAQILNLLKDLQHELGLTYLFISHNLAVVDYIADRIIVMCRGQIVEQAPTQKLFAKPNHPYTKTLMEAVLAPDLSVRKQFEKLGPALSQPEFWPAPYTLSPHIPNELVEVEEDHFVRMCPHEY